jgi:hypothetical protein
MPTSIRSGASVASIIESTCYAEESASWFTPERAVDSGGPEGLPNAGGARPYLTTIGSRSRIGWPGLESAAAISSKVISYAPGVDVTIPVTF